jgi:hypothetical protein
MREALISHAPGLSSPSRGRFPSRRRTCIFILATAFSGSSCSQTLTAVPGQREAPDGQLDEVDDAVQVIE